MENTDSFIDMQFIHEIEQVIKLVTSNDTEEDSYIDCHHAHLNGKSDMQNKGTIEHDILVHGEETQKKHSDYLEDHNALFCLSGRSFACREELQESIWKVALKQGYVTVIKKSKPKYYVIIGCNRGGKHKPTQVANEQSKRLGTGTRRIDCPFEIWGKRKDNVWKIEIKDLSHNHEPSSDLSGHPMCRRFSKEDIQLIRTMTMAGSAPREILTALRQSKPTLHSISRTVYNARSKIKMEELRGRTMIETLLEELGEGGFIYDIEFDKDNHLTHLFFAHPNSMALTKNFSNVFVMDCTYKTNKYKMPLLDIIGVSCFNTSFYSCLVFMQKEEEEDYTWALERFKKILKADECPKVIVTDRELALMNAIYKVFPGTTHLLCIWHIEKNVLTKCKKFFDKKEDFDKFLATWTNAVYSFDELSFDSTWYLFENQYKDMSVVVEYIKNSWLPYKERFVFAWTERYLHFGNHVTSRAEGAHAMLKKYLQVSTGNLRDAKGKICLAIENQIQEIKAMLQSEKIRVPHHFQIPLFKDLLGNVSNYALEQLLKQYKLATSGNLSENCRDHFQTTMGLPCAHQLRSMVNGKLELTDIHPQWRIDNKTFVTDEELDFKDDHAASLLKEFQSKYEKMSLTQKEESQRQICQLTNVSLPLMVQEPKVHKCRGRPFGSKKRKDDGSTQRDPSGFEIVEKSRRCSRCKVLGHNTRTCTQNIENNVSSFSLFDSQEVVLGSMESYDEINTLL